MIQRPHLPWAPIAARFPDWTAVAVATVCGVDRRVVTRWIAEGLPVQSVDLVATRLGFDPAGMWPDSDSDSDGDEPDTGPAATQLADHRDRHLEALIGSHGAAAELVWIKTSSVDWATTEERQIRTDGLTPATVDDYADAWRGGAVFPAGLGMPGPAGVVILAGVHRGRAYELAGAERMPIYLLDETTPEQTQYLIAVEDNSRHGVRLTLDEQIGHALRMVDELHLTMAEASRRVGVSVAKVRDARKVRSAASELHNLGLKRQWEELAPSSRWRLAMAARSDTEILAEAVMAAANAGMTSHQVYDLAARMTAARNGGDRQAVLLVIQDYEVEAGGGQRAWDPYRRGGGGGGVGAGSPVVHLRDHARAVAAMDMDAVFESCLPADRVLTVDLVKRAALALARLGARLDSAVHSNDRPVRQ